MSNIANPPVWNLDFTTLRPSSLIPPRPDTADAAAESSEASILLSPSAFSPSTSSPNLLLRLSVRERTSRLLARESAAEAFTPSHTQYVTIYTILIYFVGMLLGWNLKYVRTCLFPFKLLTVGFHECCHAIMGTLTGARVESILLDPNQGGATRMRGGFAFFSLPAGYIGSSTIGAALIFAGFDEEAAKIACIPVLVIMCLIMFWARKDWFTLCNILFSLGLMVVFYIVEHAAYLRFFILFIGVMNVMYAVWDILDDLVFQKIEASDCSHFAELYPWMPSQAWGAVWFTFAFMALCAGTLGGICLFKEDFAQQQAAAADFIPT